MIFCYNLTRTIAKKGWHPDYTVFIVRLLKKVEKINKNL